MTNAIGLIETIGVAVSFEVADAMVKAANVRIVNQETIDAALVTISVEGDLSDVNAAVEAGKRVAQRTGVLFGCSVIPRSDKNLTTLVRKKEKNTYQTIFPKER